MKWGLNLKFGLGLGYNLDRLINFSLFLASTFNYWVLLIWKLKLEIQGYVLIRGLKRVTINLLLEIVI